MNNDYFAAEDHIIAALRNQISDDVPILKAGDIDASQTKSAKLPALYLIYAGEEIRPPASPGPAQLVQQHWSVVVCVKSPTIEGDLARQSAGPIITSIIAGLQGCSLRDDMQNAVVPLQRINAAQPLYTNGRAYFDIRFALGIQT